MEQKRTSVYENGLIWFGAGVSIAEIIIGTYFAPLGFHRKVAAASGAGEAYLVKMLGRSAVHFPFYVVFLSPFVVVVTERFV